MQASSNSKEDKEAGSSKRSNCWRAPIACLGALLTAFLLAAPQHASAVPAEWGVVKTASVGQITLAPGQSYVIDYVVTVTRTVPWPAESCVEVFDSLSGYLGRVCQSDGAYEGVTKTFTYSVTVSYPLCDDYKIVNTATIVQDKGGPLEPLTSSWTVDVNVPCGGSCTLTQGYWKTHSSYGPAPHDDTWAQIIPAGADTPFFLSGKSYHQVLWTPPQGNVYYQLAHQFIASTLNGHNGADLASVSTAMTEATGFFNTYTDTLPGALRNRARALATTLDRYNNGLTGPGHCSEDTD